MSEPYGFTRSETATGLNYVVMLKPGLVGDRFCQPGDIIQVHEVSGRFHHTDRRLTKTHADTLIAQGKAKAHTPKAGEKPVSTEWREASLEAATDPGPARSERAITGRQKAGAI